MFDTGVPAPLTVGSTSGSRLHRPGTLRCPIEEGSSRLAGVWLASCALRSRMPNPPRSERTPERMWHGHSRNPRRKIEAKRRGDRTPVGRGKHSFKDRGFSRKNCLAQRRQIYMSRPSEFAIGEKLRAYEDQGWSIELRCKRIGQGSPRPRCSLWCFQVEEPFHPRQG